MKGTTGSPELGSVIVGVDGSEAGPPGGAVGSGRGRAP